MLEDGGSKESEEKVEMEVEQSEETVEPASERVSSRPMLVVLRTGHGISWAQCDTLAETRVSSFFWRFFALMGVCARPRCQH